MSVKKAIFCCSVDRADMNLLSTESIERRNDVIAMLDDFGIPSNWTLYGDSGNQEFEAQFPAHAQHSVFIPKGIDRQGFRIHLRQMTAKLLGRGMEMTSVVVNPHEARVHWDLLIRNGCHVARARTADATRDPRARVIRGGLWATPLSCQFVGGSRRTVRSLLGVCQRRLVDAARHGQIFHLGIDYGPSRKSWTEECTALRKLMKTASQLREQDQLMFAGLSEVPKALTNKPERPMVSILRVA